jgi:H/ACA ribonucleoprotein complex subunit 4
MGKGSKHKKSVDVNEEDLGQDYQIKPSTEGPKMDTSEWPILLRNFDKLNVRTSHYTPVSAGSTPLKRPL